MNKTCRTCRKVYEIGKMVCDEYRHWQCERCAKNTSERGSRYNRREMARCKNCGAKIFMEPCVACDVNSAIKRKNAV